VISANTLISAGQSSIGEVLCVEVMSDRDLLVDVKLQRIECEPPWCQEERAAILSDVRVPGLTDDENRAVRERTRPAANSSTMTLLGGPGAHRSHC